MDRADITHRVATIRRIAAMAEPGRRDVLQLGYNLGRLSELTRLGREPFWDRWKGSVARWDECELTVLAHDLQTFLDDFESR